MTDLPIAVKRRAQGAIIKANPGEMRVGGHLVVFTTPKDTDLTNQYFDKTTEFYLDAGYPIKGERILMEHGFDKAGVVPIGLFDFATVDDVGLWVEGKLHSRVEYEEMLRGINLRKGLNLSDADIQQRAALAEFAVRTLFETGKAQWSSGALPQSVEVETNGHIKSWAIIEGSATYTPAEPDGTEIESNQLEAYRALVSALNGDTPLKTFITWMEGAARKASQPNAGAQDDQLKSEGHKNMEINRDTLQKLVQQRAADMANAICAEILGEDAGELMAGELTNDMAADLTTNLEESMTDEEKRKAEAGTEDEALTKSIVARLDALEEKALERGAKLARQKQAERQNGYRSKLKGMMNDMKKTPGQSKVGGFGGDTKKTGSASVGEPLKYAHLSASDMALAVRLRTDPIRNQGIPVKATDVMSEEFLRVLKHKAARFVDSNPFGENVEANAHIKSVLPFKVNEVDASDNVGFGAEWVGDFWETTVWERARYERIYDRLVGKGVMVKEIPQGFDTAYFPTEGADPTAYAAPQANDTDSTGRPEVTANISPFATGNVSIAPGEMKLATSYTVILEEDAIVNLSKQVNYQVNEAMAEYRDRLIINGDTTRTANTNINLIDGTPGTGLNSPYYLVSNGFRKLPLVTATAQSRSAGNALALSDYRATLALLDGELRQYKDRLLFIIDPNTETASLALPEIASDDVRRTNATITSGVLENVYGIDVATNGFLPQTNTSGKVSVTPGNNTQGTIMLIYAPYWGFAFKRQIIIETGRDILSGTNIWVASFRMGIVPRGTNAASLSYNIAN
jgi:hypothetical protein